MFLSTRPADPGPTHPAPRWRAVAHAGVATALATALTGWGATSSFAATGDGTIAPFDDIRDTVLLYNYPWEAPGTSHELQPNLLTLDADGQSVKAYCIEADAPMWEGDTGYRQTAWSSYTPNSNPASHPYWQANAKKVVWVLEHSVPVADPVQVLADAGIAGVPADQAHGVVRDAAQSAIWKLAGGVTLMTQAEVTDLWDRPLALLPTDPVYRLYQWYLANAVDTDLAATLSFSAPATSGEAQPASTTSLGPVTLTSSDPTSISTVVPSGAVLRVDDHGSVTTHSGTVTNLAVDSGSTLSVVVPAGAAADSLSVTASAQVAYAPRGSIWYEPTHQSLITTMSPKVAAAATTTFSWSAAAAPVTPPAVDPPVVTPPVVDPPVVTPPVVDPPVVTPPVTKPPVTKPPVKKPPVTTPVKTTRRTFQVDRYLPRTVAQATTLAKLDDDRQLLYREDKALWGASRHEFVTVTVPITATAAELVAALNAKTTAKVGDLTTTELLTSAKTGRAVTIAWELGAGATTTKPWGASTKVAQRFFARA